MPATALVPIVSHRFSAQTKSAAVSHRLVLLGTAFAIALGGSASSSSVAVSAGQQSLKESRTGFQRDVTGTISNPNDFYYFDGKPVHLDRSLTECVVSFKAGGQEAKQKLVDGLFPAGRLGSEIRSEGRTFQIVTISAAATIEGIAQLVAQFRSNDNVEFVAPVFYQRETRARMLPTDEIVVKLKPGGTKQDLADITTARGLIILKTMPGTTDEYVLRLAQPKTGDPLEESRVLYETGRFQWAEPNFIQEVQLLRR